MRNPFARMLAAAAVLALAARVEAFGSPLPGMRAAASVPRTAAPARLVLAAPPVAMPVAVDPAVAAAMVGRMLFVGATLPITTAALSTRGSSGLPQIAQSIVQRKPPAARLNQGDSLVYLSRIIYHLRMGYAVSMWNELLLLLVQDVACLALRHTFGGSRRALLKIARDLGCLTIAALVMSRLPSRLLPLLCLWTVPLALFSYGQQAAQTAAQGFIPPAAASFSVVLLRWVASSVRLCTTTLFLGADPAVLANHLVGLCGTTVLLCQMQWYTGLGPSRLATRKVLYSQFVGTGSTPSRGGTFLTWHSLGGFTDAELDGQLTGAGRSEAEMAEWRAALFSEPVLRKAFAAIDQDGDGYVSLSDLATAITQAMEADGSTVNAEMVRAMVSRGDTNSDGRIDFDGESKSSNGPNHAAPPWPSRLDCVCRAQSTGASSLLTLGWREAVQPLRRPRWHRASGPQRLNLMHETCGFRPKAW